MWSQQPMQWSMCCCQWYWNLHVQPWSDATKWQRLLWRLELNIQLEHHASINVMTCNFSFDNHECVFASLLYSPDINECMLSPSVCEQTCTDVPGSFTCRCLSGFELQSDGISCNGEFSLQSRSVVYMLATNWGSSYSINYMTIKLLLISALKSMTRFY